MDSRKEDGNVAIDRHGNPGPNLFGGDVLWGIHDLNACGGDGFPLRPVIGKIEFEGY
jgi:hypothetical protein